DPHTLVPLTALQIFGYHATPACMTASELLRDDKLRSLNNHISTLIYGADGVSGIVGALQTAAGAASPLRVVRVPVVYVGRPGTTFDTDRWAQAYLPGLANAQSVAGRFFFPTQFGTKNAMGQDL